MATIGALLLLGALALPATAGAAPMTRMYETSFGAFQSPQNIAVDQTNGDVYVLDVKAQTISRFDSSLKEKSFTGFETNVLDGKGGGACGPGSFAWCDETPANRFSFEEFNGAQVTIDNSGNPLTNGNIYVTDPIGRVVDIFAPTGFYIGQLTRSGDLGPTFGAPCGVAVDTTGAVYVADRTQDKIHKFSPSTNPPGNADFVADLTSTNPCTLAFGAGSTAGALFVNARSGEVTKLDAAGALQYQLSAATGQGIAVDPVSGHAVLGLASEVEEYDASSASSASLLGSFGSMQINPSAVGGVAVDGPRAKAYVSDKTTGKVYVYGALTPAVPPVVSLGPVTPLLGGREGVSGYVDAEDVPTTYYFEYGEEDCAVSLCASAPATQDAQIEKSIGSVRVARTLSGLQPGTTYHYRLVASNAAGVSHSDDRTFTTLGVPPPSAACSNQTIRAAQGLAAHFPDCRAYEWVSSFAAAERSNADVFISTERIRAASDGNAFKFLSLAGAGDAQSVSLTTAYMGVRDSVKGWSTHGISPPQPAVPVSALFGGREPRYDGEFSSDLSRGVFLSTSSLNDEGPNVQGLWNLYRRDDLRAPGFGSYRLLTDAATAQDPTGEDTENPKLAGVSADLSHVLFESPRSLTADAVGLAAGRRLYMSVDGTVRLVSILPSSEGGVPAIAQAGQGFHETFTAPPLSRDGSRVVFTTAPFGADVIGGLNHPQTGGRLYLRDDHGTLDTADDTTVKLNASEKTNGAGPGGSDPAGAKPATFWAASSDFSRVFFTTTQALTNDAPTTEPKGKKLYLYDLDEPSGQRLTLLSVDGNSGDGIKNEAEGVVDVSADGSYVYFLGPNQLVAGRPLASTPRIFLWHDGMVRQVAAVNAGAEAARLLGGTFVEKEGSSNGRSGRWARVSADGKRLVFVSEGSADLAGYNHGSSCPTYASSRCTEVYMYSTGEEERLQCLSCPTDGISTRDSDLNYLRPYSLVGSLIQSDPHLNRALSSDGRFVFFTSGERLSAYDQNDSADVYEFDTSSGLTHLLSGGQPGVTSHFLEASADGSDVFFATAGALLAADGNPNIDIYDARVGGGFAEPVSAPVAPCASLEACRPPTNLAPSDLASPSAAAQDPPGQSKARPKKRRKQRGKGHKQRARGDKHRTRGKRGGGGRG